MKIRTIVAASALAATGVIGGISQSASAGCGVTITADNDENRSLTVDWEDSYVRTRTWGVAGPWKRIGSFDTVISANAQVSRAFTLDLSCNIDRQYKLEVEDGSGSFWEYHNEVGPGGTWTRDITPFFDLEN